MAFFMKCRIIATYRFVLHEKRPKPKAPDRRFSLQIFQVEVLKGLPLIRPKRFSNFKTQIYKFALTFRLKKDLVIMHSDPLVKTSLYKILTSMHINVKILIKF